MTFKNIEEIERLHNKMPDWAINYEGREDLSVDDVFNISQVFVGEFLNEQRLVAYMFFLDYIGEPRIEEGRIKMKITQGNNDMGKPRYWLYKKGV